MAIRLWHWITFWAISASLVTVILGSTLFRTKNNVTMVQAQVEGKGGSVTSQQARAVAHEYSDKLWNAHRYIGFVLCFLFLSRLVIEAALSKEQKLSVRIRRAMKPGSGELSYLNDRRHFLLVKWGYVLFYLLLFTMAITGLGLAFEDVGLFRTYHGAISAVHSFTQYLIYLYILFHIAGVIRAEFTENKGLVSAMINGGKRQDET